jgi:hypothetical protein
MFEVRLLEWGMRYGMKQPEDNGDEDFHILEGAKFLHPHAEVNEKEWSNDPGDYTITNKFRQRYSELSSVVNGDIIDDAIRYGELIKASQEHVAFMNDLGGVSISIIVTMYMGYKAVSIWPYIYDKEKARSTGKWSSRQLYEIEDYVATHKDETVDWEEY